MSEVIKSVYRQGQSFWYDNIHRHLLENGEFKRLIDDGLIYGVTSNPSIFQKAIAGSTDYDAAIQPLAWVGLGADEIFFDLAIEDIQFAADLFSDLYKQSNNLDGYVSLEVNPLLANSTEATVNEVNSLWKKVDRPNLMVKIPATKEGIPAIRRSIAAGININITLIFSIERYAEVIVAYMGGLEDRLKQGLPIDAIASVASFFVSRVDTKIDKILENLFATGKLENEKFNSLRGKAGIANSRLAYYMFEDKFDSARFSELRKAGAKIQRPLWASTSTKNPVYSDIMYMEGLIAPDTVNTVPPSTLSAFIDHGTPLVTVLGQRDASQQVIDQIEGLGIKMEVITNELEIEGVKAFSDSFTDLLATLEKRIQSFSEELGSLTFPLRQRLEWHAANRTIERLANRDVTLWGKTTQDNDDIAIRLGWLDLPFASIAELPIYKQIHQACLTDGYTQVILLGMGGSSLAPEVMARFTKWISQTSPGRVDLKILDTTDPDTIRHMLDRLTIQKTLFIVSSKSGTTSETLALLDFFWKEASKTLGNRTGEHFIAITDPETSLVERAKKQNFKSIILANPKVGGRYSALSAFGLFPAEMLEIDTSQFLFSSQKVARRCENTMPARNPGLVLGTLLTEATVQGKNKITILADKEIASFGSWLEQLIAESSGKDGKGLIPVDLEPMFSKNHYRKDRFFVYFDFNGKKAEFAASLRSVGFPVITIKIRNMYDLAAQFYLWEYATAVFCSMIGVNAFDQPNVQSSKDQTKKKIQEIHTNGKLGEGQPIWRDDEITVYGNVSDEPANNLKDILDSFLRTTPPSGYLAINAYIANTDELFEKLEMLRKSITEKYDLPTILGFGPRYLHSTGQLHKGGPDSGLFLFFTRDYDFDMDIPGQDLTFNQLIKAQALGDIEALNAYQRKILRVHLKSGAFQKVLDMI